MKNDPSFLPNAGIKKRQYIVLILTICGLLFVSFIILLIINHGKLNFTDKNKSKILIEDPSHAAKAEDRWLERSEAQISRIEKELNEAKTENDKLKQNLDELKVKFTNLQQPSELNNENELIYNDEPHEVKITKSQTMPPQLGSDNSNFNNNNLNSPFITNSMEIKPSPKEGFIISSKIEEINANLSEIESEVPNHNTKNTKNYLPAGSYAKALIISGVDASVGVTSQSDPRPVLFRVTDPAISASKDDITHTIDITGCMITGAAYGDLSSEKVFIRLLKMTCSENEELIIETDVKGYVAGLGKAGIRGVVVSREGDLVAKSFAAGLAGGLGDGIASRFSPTATINGGLAIGQPPTNKQVIGEGLGRGVSKSSDRLSDYLIHRAEQYQPVVSVASGLTVELVFEEGVYLDGRNKHNNGAINDKIK